jgi:integrase/recombinase XerC
LSVTKPDQETQLTLATGAIVPIAPKIPNFPARPVATSTVLVQEPLFDVQADVIEGEVVELGGYEIEPVAPLIDVDVVGLWLRLKPSPTTKRAYQNAISTFFELSFQVEATPRNVLIFLGMTKGQMNEVVSNFIALQLEAGRAPATVKQRVAAVRSLVSYANALDYCKVDGRVLLDNIKVETYRDTRGINEAQIKKLFKQPAKLHGKKKPVEALRDTALLVVLYENALRRAEVCNLTVGDFDFNERCLWILGKGRLERERVSLTAYGTSAIAAYLKAAGHDFDKGPLFRNFDHRPDHQGEGLTPNGLYKIVKKYGAMIGVPTLRPHKLRHSAATHALNASGGNIREVAKLTRHKNWKTLQIYDDNRADFQGKMSNLLSGVHR